MALYPMIDANKSGILQVSPLHSIYWEECGAPSGVPIVFVHGGPGNGVNETDRRFFDPSHYRSVLFEQRGCGRSTPHASLEDNNLWRLVEDMEKLREHLGIDRWITFGGSWGVTLSLAYAETHPDRCLGLILRGVFTMQQDEVSWYFQHGASHLFPEYFDAYEAVIPEEERGDILQAYHKRLMGDDEEEKLKCASAWCHWELSTSRLLVDPDYIALANDSKWTLGQALLGSHYFTDKSLLREGQLIKDAYKIKHLPIAIIQGRYDVASPVKASWDLYKALGGESNSKVVYIIADLAGHLAKDLGIQEALMDALEKFKSIKA